MSAPLGSVARLWRYPVKSMGGEECERLSLDRRGVEGDRLYAVRDPQGKLGSGKTTRRFRQIDGLLELRASYRGSTPEIAFPDGIRMLGTDPRMEAKLSDALGTPAALAPESDVPHLDCAPVHLVTTAALRWLQARTPHSRIDERRFRPNLVIDAPGVAQVERDWLGKSVCIGTAKLRIVDPAERCRMVTLAQGDLPADPRVLASILRDADLCFGVYAEVLVPGRIARNDACSLG